MFTFFEQLKQKITSWCVNERTMALGQIHQLTPPNPCEIFNEDQLKFIEQSSPIDLFVKTPTGFSPVKHSHKTVPYQVWEIKTTSHNMECADEHIIINEKNQQVSAHQLNVGDLVLTDTGPEAVTSIQHTARVEPMYDLELNDKNHVYYTNGVLSHNSTTSAAYLLWFAMFHEDKTILIVANKNDNAMEMISRIRFAYENLPLWLKPGITDDGWNKHNVGFDNGSRIISQATSESSGRGFSISLLFCDEFAFVAPGIQEEFWTSISPTLATGGSCIIASTPNGDSNLFAQLWRGAELNVNGFKSTSVKWNEPPDRDEEFKRKETAKIGELKWRQEYETEFLSSDALLISSIVLNNMKVGELPDPDHNGFHWFGELEGKQTFLIGIDPSTGNGNDMSSIEVFEFPSLVQFGEFRSNTTSSVDLYKIFKSTVKFLNSKPNVMIYFSVENNGVGEGMISLYQNDDTPPEAHFVSEEGRGRLGMTTTGKSKMKACISLKELVTKGKLKVSSKMLLAELKGYVRKLGSYSAQHGSTDDSVSATLIVVRLLEEISSYEDKAFEMLYNLGEESESEEVEFDDSEQGAAMVLGNSSYGVKVRGSFSNPLDPNSFDPFGGV